MKKSSCCREKERGGEREGTVYELYDCTVFLIWKTAHRKSGRIAVFSQQDLQNSQAPGVYPWPLLKLQPDQVSTIQKIF